MALSSKNRLKKKNDFDQVFKRGKAVAGSFLFIKFAKNDTGDTRAAFIIPARVAKKAIVRNRIKRVLSECFRINLSKISESYDVITVVTLGTDALVERIREDFLNTLRRSGLLK